MQPNRATVQGVLEGAAERLNGRPTRVHGASRTDAGVHARGQACRFEAHRGLSTAQVPAAHEDAAAEIRRRRVVRDLEVVDLPVFLVVASFGVANAQGRTDLYDCVFGGLGPTCDEVEGRLVFGLFCPTPRPYANFYGRLAWFPLRCVGPITVELEIATPPDTRFPLYVEMVALGEPTEVCNTAVGSVVMIVYGESGLCGSLVASEGIDITRVVPINGLYAIRLHSFGHPEGFSPAIDCIRVTAHPIVSRLNASSWSLVKTLYRD